MSRTIRGPRVTMESGVPDAASSRMHERVSRNRASAGWYGSVAVPRATSSCFQEGRASSRVSTSATFGFTPIERPYRWSLNPYMGCVHRCTFCYVRHFEQRADRPSDHRYGRSIRIKPNVAEVLTRELARPSWKHDEVALGTATDPYQPAEARFRLTRSCIRELAASGTPLSIVTRGPLIVRDIDVLQAAAREVPVSV